MKAEGSAGGSWLTAAYLTTLPEESGSLAVTVPMTVLMGAFSFTSNKYTGLEKTGGSSASSTTILTVAVSLKGPPLPGSERMLVASTFSV